MEAVITIDSNAPYTTDFPAGRAGDAVYMSTHDPVLGNVLAVVYRASNDLNRLSVILIGAHGSSGFVDMTLDNSSRFFGACRALAPSHFKSPVRRALAMAALRTVATMDRPLRKALVANGRRGLAPLKAFDETAAGSLGSRFKLLCGKYPRDIGVRMLDAGLISPKKMKTSVLDIVYEDSDLTISQNNKLAYLLGEQLEHLFDSLGEYNPEPTENLYAPPDNPTSTLDDEPKEVQDTCEELYLIQSRARGDLVDFMQNFLIPLRVDVLKNQIPDISIEKLNTVFPPTIDELFRVNNLLYEALRAALPLGAYEVIKACGMTIPYFYRASMRHEAATRDFMSHLAALPAVRRRAELHSIARVQSVMHHGAHLASLKLVLDRLASSKIWPSALQPTMNEYHQLASGTIDAFGKADETTEQYNRRVFTPTGKLLVEIAAGWPAELEYGWLNRRVVTIFDAVDILEVDDRFRQLHQVVIVFTDSVIICQPSEPIPTTSLSGVHLPSIGDMLMHAMLNEVPLDSNVPPLKVLAWAPILDVAFASFGPKSLYLRTGPEPLQSPSGSSTTVVQKPYFTKAYKLVQADHDADRLVEILAKAKMTVKTQQFHLFKVHNERDFTLYATVQELKGYQEEVNKGSLAVFLSSSVTQDTLDQYQLDAAISLAFNPQDPGVIDVEILSKLGYNATTSVKSNSLRDFVLSEVAYLGTLTFSSQNSSMLKATIASNRSDSERLLRWASTPETLSKNKGHRSSKATKGKTSASGAPTLFALSQESVNNLSPQRVVPSQRLNSTNTEPGTSRKPISMPLPVPGYTLEQSSPKSAKSAPARDTILQSSPLDSQRLRRKPSFESKRRTDTSTDLTYGLIPQGDSDSAELFYSSHSLSSLAAQNISAASAGKVDKEWESTAEDEEAEQRDVDAWYNQISRRDADSLSSALSEVSVEAGTVSRNNSSASESIQIGGFLNRSTSQLYNLSAANRAFAPLSSSASEDSNIVSDSGHGSSYTNSAMSDTASAPMSLSASRSSGARSATVSSRNSRDVSVASLQSDLGTTEEEESDFSYLAALVDADSISSLSSSSDQRTHPDLRDPSIVKLGKYILRNDQSEWKIASSKNISKDTLVPDVLGSNEPTPTLHNIERLSSPQDGDDPFEFNFNIPSNSSLSQNSAPGNSLSKWELDDGDDDDVTALGADGASDWLTWTEAYRKDLRASRYSLASQRNLNNTFTPPPSSKYDFPESKSTVSFRQMIMTSSLNTLQLASFTVQLEQKARTAPTFIHQDLMEIQRCVTEIFEDTDADIAKELVRRRQMIAMSWSLLKQGYDELNNALLEVEWIRRSRILDRADPSVACALWKTPSS